MKKYTYILAAIAAVLVSCQKEEELIEKVMPEKEITQEEVEESIKSYRIYIQATKGDTETKSLDLDGTGANITASWKEGEQIELFFNQKRDDKLYYYEKRAILSVTPSYDPSSATAIGDLYIDPMAYTNNYTLNDSIYTVDLFFPHAGFDYTGQKGTLKGVGSVEEKYDYAFARVRLKDYEYDDKYWNSMVFTTSGPATFQNQQSIYRFGFKNGGDMNAPVDFSEFTIRSQKEKLVVSTTPVGSRDASGDPWNDPVWTSSYGNITVIPDSAPEDHFYYVSILNEHVSPTVSETDTYTFEGYRYTDGALYAGTKEIPISVLDRQGRFISAKNVRVDRVTVPEKTSGSVTEIW